MDELSELGIRQKIYALILKNPGLHTSKIAEILKISGQLADYHLLYLERNNIIIAIKEKGYKRHYTEGGLGSQDRQRLSILRQKMPLKIVLFLLKNPNSQHKDILKCIGVAPSTLSYHLKKLIKSNIVYARTSGDEKKYLVKDKQEIIQLLIKYKPFSWIDGFKDLWTDFTWK